MEFPVHQASLRETLASRQSLLLHHSLTAAGPSLPAYMEGETDSNVSGPPPVDPAISLLRSKAALARTGNMSARTGGAEHERLLSLEQENFQLKKDISEKEEKNKSLLARLARTEEAMKRKMRGDMVAATGHRSVGNVALQFATEQRVAELEEKLRESSRATVRERERVLHFQALAKTAKGRLEETLRLQRTTRPPTIKRQRSMSALPTARRASGVLSMSIGAGNQQKENTAAPAFVQASEQAYRDKLAALEKELAAAQIDNMGLRMKVGTLETVQRSQPSGPGSPRVSTAAGARDSGSALPKSPLGRTASVSSEHAALSAEVAELRRQVADMEQLRREAADAAQLRREAADAGQLRKEAAEVPQLRRELAEARAAAAMLAEASSSAGHAGGPRRVAWGDSERRCRGERDGGADSSHLSAELRSTWERVGSLQKRYDAAAEALASINSNHEKALQQLEETHRHLNQERKAIARLSAREADLVLQLDAARELAPLLDTARRERVALEKENVALLGQAMAAPGSALAELKAVRAMLAEAQQQAAEAELREAQAGKAASEAQRACARAQEAAKEGEEARREREQARAELAQARQQVEQLTHQVRQHNSGLLREPVRSQREGRVSSPGGDPEQRDIRMELDELRTAFTEQLAELHSAEQELHQAEATIAQLKQELESRKERATQVEEDLAAKVKRLEADLTLRADRVHQLEGQVKRSLAGGPRGLRGSLLSRHLSSSQDGALSDSGSVSGSDAGSLADLEGESNIVELRVQGAVLNESKLGSGVVNTFCTFDFYEHDTQATGVVGGLSPQYGSTFQYVVAVDDFLLSYAHNNQLPVELHLRDGPDFRTVGSAGIPLSALLADSSGPAGRKVARDCQLQDEAGAVVGTLHYNLAMRRSIAHQLKAFHSRSPSLPTRRRPSADPISAAVAAAAASPAAASTVYVTLHKARSLASARAPGGRGLAPYCSYSFPGYPVHDTRVGEGPHPTWADVAEYPLMRSAPVDAVLRAATLQVHVFDDADPDLQSAGLVGSAEVALAGLITQAGGVAAEVPVKDRDGQVVGNIAVGISWQAPKQGERLLAATPAGGKRAQQPEHRDAQDEEGEHLQALEKPRGSAGQALRLLETEQAESDSSTPRQAQGVDQPDGPTHPREAQREPAGSTGRGEQAAGNRRTGADRGSQEQPSSGAARRVRGVRVRYSGSSDDEETGWASPAGTALHAESSGSSQASSQRGRRSSLGGQRHAEEAEAVQASIVARGRGLLDPEQHVVISIHKLRLGAAAVRDPAIQRIFVLYDFLPRYVPVADQRTQSVPKTGPTLNIDFTRGYSVTSSGAACQELHAMLRSPAAEDACIPFCVVAETSTPGQYHELGFTEADLGKILRTDRNIEMMDLEVVDKDGRPIAALQVSVLACAVINKVLQDKHQ